MTTRTHLSISEVLSLLKEDFPDLTITKIRYLESQGLIDPERTASGYRKFYKFDIERLRWILRQQRENFLPLKVIKKRLDSTDGKDPSEFIEPTAQPELDLARDPGKADPPPVWMADHARSTAHAEQGDRHQGAADVEQPTSSPSPEPGQRDDDPPSPDTPTTFATPATPSADAPSVTPNPIDLIEAPMPPVASAPTSAPAKPSKPKTDPAGGAQLDSGPSDVSLTRTELLKAANLTDRQLSDLESFGIVVGLDGKNSDAFGSAALISARHASTLLSVGIEARHLRAYKVAADREAGLYEQMLLPLLRQRNPASRAEAVQLLEKVTKAGTAIHAALLKQALRNMLRSSN